MPLQQTRSGFQYVSVKNRATTADTCRHRLQSNQMQGIYRRADLSTVNSTDSLLCDYRPTLYRRLKLKLSIQLEQNPVYSQSIHVVTEP